MRRTFVALIAFLLSVFASFAQLTIDGKRLAYDRLTHSYLLSVPLSEFGKQFEKPIVIDDTVSWVLINGRQVRTSVNLPVVDGATTYTMVFSHKGVISQVTLRFTCLPIVCMQGNFNDVYSVGDVQVTLPEEHQTQDYRARIKWAGGTTLYDWIEKHNYHIKFIDENGEKMDVSFFGLRKDNHWRLDAGIIDMLRFRNKVAHSLWADFQSKPYYADVQPKAMNYSRGEHVEVFLNGVYMGFFDMAEFLDRKQMKLKKYDDLSSEFHGLMWKGKEVTRQTLFRKDSVINNTQEHWAGFDLMYPDIDDVNPTDYSLLNNAIKFVATSDDATFASQVGEYFDLPVLADYYVFITMLFAIDNSSKNVIWGCYDSAVGKKLTLAVWDLEATVGQHWYDGNGFYHAPEIQPEKDLLNCRFSALNKNKLFMRLLGIPEFKRQVVYRYWQLRRSVLEPNNLIARYKAVLDALETSGALARESERWSGSPDIYNRPLDFYGEFEYLSDWIRRRVVYLDNNDFAGRPGDVDNDGDITIGDVTLIIDYLNTGEYDSSFVGDPDADGDGKVNISDVIEIIDILLGH
jgi:hypothetical protein